MKLVLARLFSLLFFLQVIMPPALSAELTGLPSADTQPPVILFDAGNNEIESGLKTFSATVTDNVGVATVTLFFKGETDIVFKSHIMKQSDTDPSLYTKELFFDHVIVNKVQIYIRADDISGNSIFEGQKFSPRVFSVIPAGEEIVIHSVTEPPVQEEEGTSTLTWILLGIGAIVLAGSIGGGGGGGGGSSSSSSSGSVGGSGGGTVTVTGDVPN
jgi:hypothetical protein